MAITRIQNLPPSMRVALEDRQRHAVDQQGGEDGREGQLHVGDAHDARCRRARRHSRPTARATGRSTPPAAPSRCRSAARRACRRGWWRGCRGPGRRCRAGSARRRPPPRPAACRHRAGSSDLQVVGIVRGDQRRQERRADQQHASAMAAATTSLRAQEAVPAGRCRGTAREPAARARRRLRLAAVAAVGRHRRGASFIASRARP